LLARAFGDLLITVHLFLFRAVVLKLHDQIVIFLALSPISISLGLEGLLNQLLQH
jgi:hypothetical protein